MITFNDICKTYVKEAAQKAEASQLSTLAEAGEALQDAAKDEQDAAKDEKADNRSADQKEEKEGSEANTGYYPIDVRL